MNEKIYKIKNKVWHSRWYKWLALVLLILWLVCLLFKCCDNENKLVTGDQNDSFENIKIDQPYSNFPDNPSHPLPIDTNFSITLPEDPLQRKIISNLVNAYCQDTVSLNRIANEVIEKFKKDSVIVTFVAEEYKRVQFRINPDSREKLLAYLKQDKANIKFAMNEWYIQTSGLAQNVPSDPDYKKEGNSWFYKQIGLYDAWDKGFGSDTLIIAVIDDGFDLTHIEFKGKIVKPWNVIDYSENVNASNNKFHGSHVAGTICANMNNGFGISGVAPKCRLMPIQIADNNGNMSLTSIIDGIFYALKNDADIINMSLGQELSHLASLNENEQEKLAYSLNLEEAEMWNEIYEIALKENTIIVQAAGNSSVLASIDPMKRSKSSIVVGALDKNNNASSFTNYGNEVDVYAPGVKIYSSMPNNKMGYLDGTSMASPIVSGCIALLRSKNAKISVSEIKILFDKTGLAVMGEKGKMIQVDKLLEEL